MRDKLYELLHCNVCESPSCAECQYDGDDDGCISYMEYRMADHLIANGVTVQKWIPVSERFPEKCVDYLCLCVLTDVNVKPFCMVLRYIRDHEPHFQYEWNGNIKVTHWMPLPEPPKEDDHG